MSLVRETFITVVGGCVVCALLMLGQRATTSRKEPPKLPSVGESFAPKVPWRWGDARTIVLATKPDCPYCRASGQFHRKLVTSARDGVAIRVLVPSRSEAFQYVSDLGVAAADVYEGDLRSFKIAATPTLLVVDSRGVVLSTWLGQLKPKAEEDVLKAVKGRFPYDITEPEFDRLASSANLTRLDIFRRDFGLRNRPGWISIPADELEARGSHELAKPGKVVVDCDGSASVECDVSRTLLLESGAEEVALLNRGRNEPQCKR